MMHTHARKHTLRASYLKYTHIFLSYSQGTEGGRERERERERKRERGKVVLLNADKMLTSEFSAITIHEAFGKNKRAFSDQLLGIR